MSDERIELAPWIVDMAQRVVDNHSGEWLTPTWIVAQEALGSVDGWPNDGHSEFVALLIDELVETRQRLAAAEAEARWLLYDAPGRPYSEVEAFVRERPWLNCLKSSNSPTGGKP